MKEKKLGQEPAFADPMRSAEQSYNNQNPNNLSCGMSKRFYAACAAMQGILSDIQMNGRTDIDNVIKHSYRCADELLKQEDSDE
jgi:hypothetical protein